MRKLSAVVVLILTVTPLMRARAKPYPPGFRHQNIQTNGVTLFVRVGGSGLAVVLLYGSGDTGDMWAPLAAELARTHTVVVPDLHDMGLSSHPEGSYDRRTQTDDIRAVLTKLNIDQVDVVGHGIGTIVAFAYATRYPDKTTRLVVMDAPVPGVPPWEQIIRSPKPWYFSFGGPDTERPIKNHERIYLDRFWNEFAGNPSKIDEATRVHYVHLYAEPGAMHSAFAQFLSIPQDAEDNQKAIATGLPMPVLAIGGAKSFDENGAIVVRNAATNMQALVIPDAGHWLMEEQTQVTVDAVVKFLAQQRRSS